MRIIKMLSGKGDTWRRVLALFLACVMLFSIMPVQSFAESAKDMGFTDGTELTDGSDFTDGTEDPAAGTDSTDSTDPADGTNPTDSGDPAEEVLQEETVPKDITNCTDQLTLSMKKWWFETHENAVEANEEKYVDFSGFAQNPEASEWTGVTLQFEAAGVLAGDWFTVVFSRQFSDVQIEDGYIFPEEIESALKETEQGTELTVRFSAAGALAGELPLKFKMSASEKISMLLQQDVNNKNEYMVIPPAVEPEELLSAAVLPESGEPEEEILSANVLAESDEPEEENLSENDLPESGESEEELFSMTDLPEAGQSEQGISLVGNNEPDNGTFSIRGEIVFDEKRNGTDWRSILRPLEFDQEIKLIATYEDTEGNGKTVEYHAQDNLPQDPFYMMMTHDGEGGGSFEIVNVPKKLTLDNGTEVNVAKYNVSVDEKYPYYKNEPDGFDVTNMGATQTISTLKLTLKYQKLTLDPKVVGDQTEAAFPMDVTFTNPCGAATEKPTLTKTVNPKNTVDPKNPQSATIQVPVGIDFQVVQRSVEGYKLYPQYTITTQTGEQKTESTQNGKATGTIVKGTDVNISTINYMQNRTYPFTVTWVDNNASDRPALGQNNFKLQYRASTKNENGETVWEKDESGNPVWRELTADKRDFLGIDALPTFDTSKAVLGQYVYRGLPSVDKYGNPLSYRVEPGDLSGYTVSANDNYNEFTYRQTTSFNAAISWLDSDNADGKRPGDLPLKLYRRAANENYEEVEADLTVTENGNTWNVSANGLPRYNDSNQEYDYVIVQGTIGENNTVTQTEITSYRTDYNNGTGNFGNDIALCHNGGKISQRISGEVDFRATKKWRDNLTDINQRPETTVTLWRYSVPNEGNHSIDTMYNAGQAAQVIYRKTVLDQNGNQGYEDVLLAYNLSKTNTETITFDQSTVPDLPADFKLPAYDEQGRRYVYFVRETVDSQNYEISYTLNNSKTYENGAPNNGTITNTRREKSAVNVTKVWQCPSNLPDIEDTSIQMEIWAPNPNQEGTYEELTVYDAALNSFKKLTGDAKTTAQTLSGFKENIATLDLQFYVNIYDENGLPYDMTEAVIQEIKVLKKDGEVISDIPVTETGKGTGTFELKGNKYTAASAYVKQTVLADGMKQFQYKETNTISGERNYKLIKKWQGFTTDDLANYDYVSFKLTRRSSKDGATPEVVKTSEREEYWKVSNQGGDQWSRLLENLPKYDNQGYEYLYSAEEVSVTDKSGNIVSGWDSYHYRTEDSTTVTNYIGTGGGSDVLFVTKTWMDNGDTDARKWVKVRIYRKSDVCEALNSKGDGDVISLDNLGIGYAEYGINLAGLTEMTLSDVENKIVANSEGSAQNLTVKDYIILEYKVSSGTGGETAATYTASQLKAAVNNSSTTVSGKVSNSQRQYETLAKRENDRLVTITNTRTGQASLEVTKNWLDEKNAGGKRPDSVKFQVYQEGQEYKPGADSGIGSITPATGNVSAVWDPSAGTITVTPDAGTNTAESWFFRLENLPLFSETGVPHTYNVEEIDEATSPNGGKSQTGTFSYYLSTKGETTVTENQVTPDLVTYQFSFTNTLTGTTVHSAHKTWNDRDSGGFDRPDLYLTLWRYLKSDAKNHSGISVEKLNSYDQYTDCEDPVWTVIDAYHWRADVTGLPLYNENGQEYVYRFQETLNNNGVTVYGTYRQEAEYGVTSQCNTCAKLNSSYTTPYDQFINTLTDVMTVSGVKTWTGFGGYQIDQKDYPKVTIELYRSLDPTINPLNQNDEVVNGWISAGRIEKVNKTVTMEYDEESKTYPTEYSFGTGTLPKFNEEGRRWYYSVREVLPDGITDSLYTERFANGTLTNEFLTNVNRRSIKVTKTWVRENLFPNEENKYPSVTYYLYRHEEGKTAPSQPLKTVTINASEFANSKNGQYTYTFEDLLIYSPSGKPYRYYIKEKAINGYTVSYTDESEIDNSCSGNGRSDVISVPNDIENPSPVDVGTTNNYSDPGKMKIIGQKYWNDYGNSTLIYGKRPSTIEVTLKRCTQNESGQINAVTEEIIDLKSGIEGSPKIEWEVLKTDKNFWEYTIDNLERYAPNGMPYIYSVTESPVDGYRQSSGTVTGTAGTEGDLVLNVLTNSLGTTYYVRKNWMDGNNKYGLRPTSITVVLQRSNDNGANWENIQWDSSFGIYDAKTGKWTGLPSVTTDGDGKNIVSITLTSANEIANTRHNSWQYTFTNLPEKDASGNTWKYRCIETKIGNANVKENNNNTLTAGAYTCTYPTQNDTKTVIQNKLESTSLYVKKDWEKDQNDLYHSRPESLTFVLQMRGIKKVDASSEGGNTGGGSTEGGNTEGGGTEGEFELTNWQNVKVNGSDYTFTLSPDKWETVLQDLPVAVVAPDGTTYYTLYFRAVEKHADDTTDDKGNIIPGTKVLGALNYTDKTDYSTNYDPNDNYNETTLPNHYYNNSLNRNESHITNELILDDPAQFITVTKNWKRQSGESVTATFELLYKTVNEGENDWHCFGNQFVENTWTGHTHDKGCVLMKDTATDTVENTLTWNNLPMYDRAGKILEYKVVEHPVTGYKTEEGPNNTFTNIELQSYTVEKIWQNTSYAEKTDAGFTAEFKLQQKIGNGYWEDAKDESGNVKTCTLTSTSANDTQSHTWKYLPKYTTDGTKITYRAVETKINGETVVNNTNGSYIVTYQYGNDSTLKNASTFADTQTVATNRMVYGFVNLSKTAAYLAPGVTTDESGNKKLKDVVFNIYAVTDTSKKPYVSGVKTDNNGNLIRNDDGTYGTEKKHLISGTYTLMEQSTNSGYSVWKNGVTFVVGTKGVTTDTGEHGTAWISTSGIGSLVLSLKAEYKHSSESNHTFANSEHCAPVTNGDNAYNLESRGVIKFTKTGPNGATLDIHANATGESKAYFGVYTNVECTEQVAGMMADTDGKTMVLTTRDTNGTDKKDTFCGIKNSAQIPYLRSYKQENVEYLTLLSGTYYLEELVAPPGYKLDDKVREAVVPMLDTTDNDSTDLSTLYSGNIATIEGLNENKWPNTENQVTIYKRDQYGRPVELGTNGYLELSVDTGLFLTGENTIRLYQNTAKPATKADGSDFVTGSELDIAYDSTNGCWTIKGLFDINKTYTLSEPDNSVPENNIKAKDFVFTMGADGKITVSSTDAISKENPLAVAGNDYENYYKSDSGSNIVVLRDTARYLTDVALKKIDSTNNNKKIKNISFTLWKYDSKNTNGTFEGLVSVLGVDQENNPLFLTTDSNGQIQLKTTEGYINQVTHCDLKYGLDVGKYYFQEIERGASDTYQLLDKIFFEIKPKNSGNITNYEDYATVEFATTTDGPVSQEPEEHSATVKNTPVTVEPKTLELTKVDSKTNSTKLKDARFTLTYTSVNNTQAGAQIEETFNCKTDDNGDLYLCGASSWEFLASKVKPDISRKGTYVLKEIQAPDYYMTRTPEVEVIFEVNSNNEIKVVKCSNDLVSANVVPESGEHTKLQLTVKNEKTVVSISKRNDIESGTKTSNQKKLNGEPLSGATLEIYEGVYNENSSPLPTSVTTWTSDSGGSWSVEAGTLKEDTIYTLHEQQAPVGYLPANDIYFKLFGTTTNTAAKIVSQLYVWTGNGTPTDVTETGWSKSSSIKDTVLTMVDEAIIAPVDLRKVLQESTNQWTALKDVEFSVSDGTTTFGTAITNEKGYLIWKTIQNVKDASGEYLIYDTAGLRITQTGDVQSQNMPVILRQNTAGYQFTETYAPDNAYNDGRTYHIKITEENYKQYRTTSKTAGSLYNLTKYINIVDAEGNASHTVANLTQRDNNTTQFTNANGLAVNLPYKSTVTLHKYDADEEANNAPIPDTEFTLYHATVSGSTWTKRSVVTDAYVTGKSTPNDSGVFTTDTSGDLSIEIHNKGYYILEETKAAAGYRLDAVSFRFILIDDETKPYGYNRTTVLPQSGVPNERLKGTVTLMKKDNGTHEALNGVVFTLTRTDTPAGITKGYLLETPLDVTTGKVYEAVKDNNGAWKWKITDGTAGEIKVIGLNWGSYKLQEKTEKSGYIHSATEYSFDVKADNVKADNPTFHQDVSNKKNQITFYKTDNEETPKGLAGAVFEVHEGTTCSSCTPVEFYSSDSQTGTVTSVISGDDGNVDIYGLPTDTGTNTPKTYHLVETTAPKGYKLASPVTFTIDRYGKVQVNAADVDKVQMKDEPIELFIEKTGEVSTDKLADAQFRLTDICTDPCDHKLANGADSESVTTDSDGKVMIPIERVIAGHTYRLEETKAPDGYECTAVITFKVKEDGTAERLTTTGGHTGATLGGDKKTFQISNEKIRVSLTKVDYENDTKKLAGVTFTLKPADGSEFAAGYSGPTTNGAVTMKTGTDGKINIPEGLMKHDNSYILTETDLGSNTSYRLAANDADRQITFRVEKDGTITITSPNDMFKLVQDTQGNVTDATALVVSNQQITLEVSKLDQATGANLAGVTLKLSKKEESSWNPVKLTGVTDNNGQWTTTNATGAVTFKGNEFTPGTYKLKEINTPDGYNSITGPLIFTIDKSGKVTSAHVESTSDIPLVSEGNEPGKLKAKNFTITNPTDGRNGDITLKVDNAAYSDLQITKKGSDGTVLNDVEFRLDYKDGTDWKYVKLNSNGKVEVTDHALTPGTAEEAKCATDYNGVVTFSGLPNGKYRLTELKTAQGYNLLSVPLEVEIDRNGEIYTVSYNGGTAQNLTRQNNTLLLTVINQKGFVLPATGTTTPELPKAVLGLAALIEGLVLYKYQSRGKRRKRKG